jgi:hypothetical protein
VFLFPPEPPVAITLRPERRAAVKGALVLARRSEPLTASTVLAFPHFLDGRRSGNMFLLVSFEQVLDSNADDSPVASATIDHTDMRGSEPQGHDPSGAASD